MNDVILGRYAQGAVLVGISAGAVQLGRYGIVETPESPATELLNVFSCSPWSSTRTASEPMGAAIAHDSFAGGAATGLGIPSGGDSSCTRIPPSGLCDVPRTNSVSRALASRTHCCAFRPLSRGPRTGTGAGMGGF